MNLVNDLQTHRSPGLVESIDRTPQQVLSFALDTSAIAASAPPLLWSIGIDRVTELVNIPIDRVVPMPQLPPAVMGVYNWRGEILWIVDLAMLLGIGSARRQFGIQPTIAISDANGDMGGAAMMANRQARTIGLVVAKIAEIEWCELDLLGTSIPNYLQPELARWLQGMWRSERGENFLGLDGQAIFAGADSYQADRADLVMSDRI